VEGLKLGPDELLEVITTFSATEQAVPAVAATPGWFVVGAFRMRASMRILLSAIVSVSDTALTLRGRLFDLTAAVPVPIFLSTQSMVDEYVQSGPAELTGGHVYQMQVEVVGDGGEEFFGSVKNVGLVAADA
jgi:hypothetical protein